MGLTSLPLLNKISCNTHTTYSFQSNKQELYNYGSMLTLDLLINIFSIERFGYNVFNDIKNKRNYKTYLNTKKNFSLNNKKTKTILGEFWFFIYSDFIIISYLTFNSNIFIDKLSNIRLKNSMLTLTYLSNFN